MQCQICGCEAELKSVGNLLVCSLCAEDLIVDYLPEPEDENEFPS